MSEERPLNHDEREFVEALGGLLPAPPDVSEQRLWYEAGLRAGRRRTRAWGAVAAAMVLLAVGVAALRPRGPIVYVDRVVPQETRQQGNRVTAPVAAVPDYSRPAVSIDYVRLRDAVEQRGLDALGESGSGALSQPSLRALSPPNAVSVPSPWDSINSKG
jgi:hypothetical protein